MTERPPLSTAAAPAPSGDLIAVGWRERVSLPDLGIGIIRAKVDTGARTSALHADHIYPFEVDGDRCVRFIAGEGHECTARVLDERRVRNSGGFEETRFFIRSRLVLGSYTWEIDLSLTSRRRMKYGMLLGREAMNNRIVVHPAASWLQNRPSHAPTALP